MTLTTISMEGAKGDKSASILISWVERCSKMSQNHNMLWSSRKLTHRYMEGVAEQLSTLKNRLKTTENHNMLWYGTNSAHRYMEERLKNWKSGQICAKTTRCSGHGLIALIDIWKRWPHWEEELMNWWNLVWSSARSAAYQGKRNKQIDHENSRTSQSQCGERGSCLGIKIGFAYRLKPSCNCHANQSFHVIYVIVFQLYP